MFVETPSPVAEGCPLMNTAIDADDSNHVLRFPRAGRNPGLARAQPHHREATSGRRDSPGHRPAARGEHHHRDPRRIADDQPTGTSHHHLARCANQPRPSPGRDRSGKTQTRPEIPRRTKVPVRSPPLSMRSRFCNFRSLGKGRGANQYAAMDALDSRDVRTERRLC